MSRTAVVPYTKTQKMSGKAKKPLVAIFCFALTLVAIASVPETKAFWKILNFRFSQDLRFQAQTIFLPTERIEHQLLIVGDSLFLPELEKTHQDQSDIVLEINGYDPNDLAIVGSALRYGRELSETRICTILVQVSPIFVVRAKAIGPNLDVSLLKENTRRRDVLDDVKYFFEVIQTWGSAQRSENDTPKDAMRPARLVGQARFADPNDENWESAFTELLKHEGQVIGVLDERGTDWGPESDVVRATREKLDMLAHSNDNFDWLHLDELDGFTMPRCTT